MKTWHLILNVKGTTVCIPFLVDDTTEDNDSYEIGEELAENFPKARYLYTETSPC